LWFLNFSTWDGVHGIYLEDLYVTPEQRGNGLGKQLLEALAQECIAKGYTRLQWWVLNWNEPSIGFYRSLGAIPMDEWTVMRVADEALAKLGASL
jgi:GNAT superfamily N-acetyltransferase